MSDLRTAAQQALEALAGYRRHIGDTQPCDAEIALLDALAQQDEPVQKPVAWLQPKTVDGYSRPDLGYETCSKDDYGAFPVYRVPPRCPNCASLEAQNNELDRKLAELEREPQTLDEAMQQPRAMAQAYENGYKAGEANERERIIQFLQEMQRVVGDAHNHYGVAAVRIKAGI